MQIIVNLINKRIFVKVPTKSDYGFLIRIVVFILERVSV